MFVNIVYHICVEYTVIQLFVYIINMGFHHCV